MNKKSISILGSGWLGLPLAKYFSSKGFCVKASTTSENRLSEIVSHKIKPFVVDIKNLTIGIKAFLKSEILIINIPYKESADFRKLIVEIEKSDIQKVLFVSSTSVYKDLNKTILEEDEVETRNNPLFIVEKLFRNSEKFNTTVIRFGGLIGYGRNPVKHFIDGRPIKNSESNVNLIHLDDCIGIIGNIIERNIWSEVFNCCADTHPTKKEYYTEAARQLGFPIPNFEVPDEKSFKIISNKKVKHTLNYQFKHPDLLKIPFDNL
ncbi:MAG: hypothetical protein JEY94_17340 [Melioribacteraceae bacterium]|nr:hypothetical protein [Melioribacteraceae bacterium]